MVTQKKQKKTSEKGLLGSDCVSPLEFGRSSLQLSLQFEKQGSKESKRYDNIMYLEVNYDDVPARNRMGTIPSQLAVAEALGSV